MQSMAICRRRTGVQTKRPVRRRGEAGLALGKVPQPILPLAPGLGARELEVLLEVPRLRAGELIVESRHWRRQPRREQPEALARARLDQRAREEQIELAARIGGADSPAQARGIAAGPLAVERHPERGHELLHLLEV